MSNAPEPNPHVAENNACAEYREIFERRKPPYPMVPFPERMTLNVQALLEDKARLDFLEEMGATWQIPFIEDGPLSFNRGKVDWARRKLE